MPKPKAGVKSFTIDRSKWINGHVINKLEDVQRYGEACSELINSEGRMCCLGFYGKACGIPKKDLVNISMPDIVDDKHLDKWGTGFVRGLNGNTATTRYLMNANDDQWSRSEQVKPEVIEDKVKTLFAKVGVKVKYVGKYPTFRKKK